ncbi:hypothetical protein O181_068460 [Austropuccinia psidii MF-1]|uniref:Uncharacterized protein n=1 Tax=Austropuccinia psidii MF-1 TaxID=1389203 RepID=A0A9Q3I732_9BASI|nr:hypothetical protein [Austropuccinia psidii MF-1]
MAHTIYLGAHDFFKALDNNSSNYITSTDEVGFTLMSIASLVDPPNFLNLQYNSIIRKISFLNSFLRHRTHQKDRFVAKVNPLSENRKPSNANALLSQVPKLWNSTYKMLNCTLELKDEYNQFCTLKALESYWLSPI